MFDKALTACVFHPDNNPALIQYSKNLSVIVGSFATFIVLLKLARSFGSITEIMSAISCRFFLPPAENKVSSIFIPGISLNCLKARPASAANPATCS